VASCGLIVTSSWMEICCWNWGGRTITQKAQW